MRWFCDGIHLCCASISWRAALRHAARSLDESSTGGTVPKRAGVPTARLLCPLNIWSAFPQFFMSVSDDDPFKDRSGRQEIATKGFRTKKST